MDGLKLVPNSLVLPHHNTFGKNWAPKLLKDKPDITLLGIDEQTGMIDEGNIRAWTVYGAGSVTHYQDGRILTCSVGTSFALWG